MTSIIYPAFNANSNSMSLSQVRKNWGRLSCLRLITWVCPPPRVSEALLTESPSLPFPYSDQAFGDQASRRHSTSGYSLQISDSNQLTRHCHWLSIPVLLSLSWFLPTSLWHPRWARNSGLRESLGWLFALPTRNLVQPNSPTLLTTTRYGLARAFVTWV
jgi:hypothetical protein